MRKKFPNKHFGLFVFSFTPRTAYKTLWNSIPLISNFEGPFDLLLFFIKRDEIDIHDIPIAKITEDFLTYIEEAKRLDISLASDFIVMAASLIRIKSKTLLPRYNQEIEDGGEDPRQSFSPPATCLSTI